MELAVFESPLRWTPPWPGGARIMQARPLAVRLEEAPWHTGLPLAELRAFNEARKLPFIELDGVTLVMIRDLEALLCELSGDTPKPTKRDRRRGKRSPDADTPLAAA